MKRALAWSVALSAMVAMATTFMLNGACLRAAKKTEHSVQVVVSILGRAVTIGVSVEKRNNPVDSLEYARGESNAGTGRVP